MGRKRIEYYCVVADERSAIILQSLTEQQKTAIKFLEGGNGDK